MTLIEKIGTIGSITSSRTDRTMRRIRGAHAARVLFSAARRKPFLGTAITLTTKKQSLRFAASWNRSTSHRTERAGGVRSPIRSIAGARF
jgi:hypothetical protein